MRRTAKQGKIAQDRIGGLRGLTRVSSIRASGSCRGGNRRTANHSAQEPRGSVQCSLPAPPRDPGLSCLGGQSESD